MESFGGGGGKRIWPGVTLPHTVGGFFARPVASNPAALTHEHAPLSLSPRCRPLSPAAVLSFAAEFERLHLPPSRRRCRRSHRRHERHRRSDGVGASASAALTKAEAAATQQRPDAPRPCLGFSDAPPPRVAARRSRLHPRRWRHRCRRRKRRLPLPPDREPLALLPHEAFPRPRRRRLLRSQKRARVAETGSVQRRPPGKGGRSRGGQAKERPPAWAGPRSASPQIKAPALDGRASTRRQPP
ncbi:uncharacterized protein PHA67_011086 isoform 1-T3 [Liasis olivaceus]